MAKILSLAGPGLFCLSVLSMACGVPILAADLTATAETDATPTGVDGLVLAATIEREGLTPEATPTAEAGLLLAAVAPTPSPTPVPETPVPPVATTSAAPPTTPSPVVTPAATATAAPPTPTPVPVAALTDQALTILNDFRAESGLSPLRHSPTLAAAAGNYAAYMAQQHFFGHYGPDGSTPRSRVAAAGYGGLYWGEALAGGQSSARNVVFSWLNSPSHAAILLDPSAVDVGIGYAYNPGDVYRFYWVLNTGVP